ncbi:MAG: leucine-rich repeat protein [Proteobacteria bacterium]|nr:leucine-rich repeat protein [Pseudomonadota bacterium]
MFRKQFLNATAFVCASFLVNACVHASDSPEKEAETDIVCAQATSMADVPNEITDHILSFLDVNCMIKAKHVCQTWEEIATHHNSHAPLFSLLFEPTLVSKAFEVPDKEMAATLFFHIKQKGFAPLENVFISPNCYPQDTHLLNASDLAAHPDMVSAWYAALFGKEVPQDTNALALVMSALPQILVQDQLSEKTFAHIASYVRRVGQNSRFMHFMGGETQEDLEVLKETPHTFVVCSNDLQDNKDTLAALLDTRNDHSVVLSFDSDAFLQEGVLTMSKNDIPENLHHLTLADPFGKVTAIGDRFLLWQLGLTSFSARGLTSLTTIGNSFLTNCAGLTHFDTRGLSQLKAVGDTFLVNCQSLTYFDARGLSGLETIGIAFLGGCADLTYFSSLGLENVTTVGDHFLSNNQKLAYFDAQGLSGLKTIGDRFLWNCKALPSFYALGLSNLETIGESFLMACTGLTYFSSQGMEKVTAIGHNFLVGLPNLTDFDTQGLVSLKTVGSYFLHQSTGLSEFDTQYLGALESIGNYFLSDCPDLAFFDAQNLTSLKKIGQKPLSKTGLSREEWKKVDTFFTRVRQANAA